MVSSAVYRGVSLTGEAPKSQEVQRDVIEQTTEQQDRAKFVHKRVTAMQNKKDKYMGRKRAALMLYDGISRMDGNVDTQLTKEEVVAPIARAFVDAKTAEEVKAYSDIVFYPVDDENDAWKAELLSETVEHVRRVTKARANRQELIRMKNIIGVSAKWKSYRSTTVKMNVAKVIDDKGTSIEWEEMDVPGEDEIFEDIIDPINELLVDPSATADLDKMLDFAIYFQLHHEEAAEIFGHEIYDFDGVDAGPDGMVEGIMYFKKPSSRPDMLCIYAWPSNNYGAKGMVPGHVKEVYYGGLPDEHKKLPLVAYFNIPTFTSGFFNEIARSNSGEAAPSSMTVTAKQEFWAYAGDPEIIMDLIDLRTAFGRSLYKACDLAGRSLVLTKGEFRIDTSIDWQHGDEIPGGMGKVDTKTFGVANLGAFQATLDDVFNLMILGTGTDPRNLTDTKQKTLGETIAQRETMMTRLDAIIDFNQEHAEVRDGFITHSLVQQYYTKMKVVRLTGVESPEELNRFDETEGEHPRTGQPLVGKSFRRIRTSKPIKELKAKKSRRLKKDDTGKYSFLARPEYIRTSTMDVVPITKRKAGELAALKGQQLADAIDKYIALAPLTVAQPGQSKPAISPESLPPVDELLKEYWKSIGVAGKDKVKGGSEEKIEAMKNKRRKMKTERTSITDIPTPQPAPPVASASGGAPAPSPQVPA